MTDLYNQVYTSRPPIINGLLYPGTYILAGAPKLGKSFLMAQLAYHVSTGTEMWGFQVQKGSVLYLALEDDYGRLQKRLYKMFGVETAKNLYFGIEAPSLGDGLIDLLEGFVEDHPDTRLIIVDTLQKVRGNNDGHTYSSDYQDICRLKHFTDSRNLCLMIVNHTRKQQSEDRFDTISGTNGLLGAADGAFLLTKAKRTANDAVLDIAGRDQQDQRMHLVRNTKTLLWDMESAETELWEEEPDPLLEEVAKVVSEDNPKWEGSVTALAKLIQYSASPISLAMKLNVCADRLKQDYHIKYERFRSHKGRGVRLAFELSTVKDSKGA
jgi:RecA-family ATPase